MAPSPSSSSLDPSTTTQPNIIPNHHLPESCTSSSLPKKPATTATVSARLVKSSPTPLPSLLFSQTMSVTTQANSPAWNQIKSLHSWSRISDGVFSRYVPNFICHTACLFIFIQLSSYCHILVFLLSYFLSFIGIYLLLGPKFPILLANDGKTRHFHLKPPTRP